MPCVEFYAGVMCAGLVNAHTHIELSYLRGAIEKGCGFSGFAQAIGRVRGLFSDEERQRAILAADAEMWRGGVSLVGDIANGDTTFAMKSQSKIDYHTFIEIFGLQTTSYAEQMALLSYPNTSLTPHSTYSIQDATLRAIAAQGTAPLSIHFMESPSESELYDRRGGLWSWYAERGFKCDFLHYGSPAKRIVASVPPERSVMLVHNCCLRQQDIDTIMEHFTAPVYWVICPRSNDYISHLTPPVEILRRNGLNICIGTDSLASNDSLSMIDEIRAIHDVPLCELLQWATANGAAALGATDRGRIEVGMQADMVVLSGIDYDTMQLTERTRITRIV